MSPWWLEQLAADAPDKSFRRELERVAGPALRSESLALTPYPVRVTSTGPDALRNAVDVLDLDEMDLVLRVLALEGAGADVTVGVETAMQNEDDALGWVTVASFASVSSAPDAQIQRVTGFLRYVRYNVTVLSATAATFMVQSVGRRWSSRTESE